MSAAVKYDDTLPRLRFANGGHAYSWAEEALSRPVARGMFHTLLRTPGAAEFTPDEIRDLAHTISTCVSMVGDRDRRGAAAFRHVHGQPWLERKQILTQILRDQLLRHLDGQRKTEAQRTRVAWVAVTNARVKVMTGKALPRNRYAKELGIRKQSLFSGGWPALIEYAEDTFALWVNNANAELERLLHERGIL